MNTVQKEMSDELFQKSIFSKAFEYGLEYLEQSGNRHVFPKEEAIAALKYFEEKLPEDSGDTEEILEKLHKLGSPATVSQIGGRYFGFVNGGTIPCGMAAKILATFWDQNAAMYVLSPITSKLETVVEGWLREALGLPENVVAGFVSGSSIANLSGLAAARYRLLKNLGWYVNTEGLSNAPKIRIITSKETHSTVIKTLAMLGYGKRNIEFVDTDEQGRIRHESIPELDEKTLLILAAGNVNSGSFDHFENICSKARAAGAWVHIDGAFGLWAAASTQLSHLTKGIELANSWAVDGHKTLNTPYDSGIILCADPEALRASLHMSGEYLVLSEERDGMFYTPEMSKRARAIELWATMKYLGKKGIDQMVTNLHLQAKEFANCITEVDGLKVLNDVVFNQVLVCCGTDELTEKVLKNIQEQRVCWVGGSTWKGRRVIRVSISSWVTNEEDIKLTVGSFKKAIAACR